MIIITRQDVVIYNYSSPFALVKRDFLSKVLFSCMGVYPFWDQLSKLCMVSDARCLYVPCFSSHYLSVEKYVVHIHCKFWRH